MEDATLFYRKGGDVRGIDNAVMHTHISNIIRPSSSLLEIGCANGEMLSQYPFALGIDCNQSMVDYAGSIGNMVRKADICDEGFAQEYKAQFDIVCANYVFTEFPRAKLQKAFENIALLMKPESSFLFTITNPRIRQRQDLPGYKILWPESYKHRYCDEDVPFTVLLEQDNEFVDVGIRDYHNPVEVYANELATAGLTEQTILPLDYGYGFNHALLFKTKKEANQSPSI